MKIRVMIAALFAAFMVLLPVANANAAGYFDRLYVTSGSNGKIVMKDGTRGSHDLWQYQDSYLTFGWNDVDYFWVPGGCDATNVNTGYVYVGNKQYGPLPGNASLDLRVVC